MRGLIANEVIDCIEASLNTAHVLPAMHLRGQLGADSLDYISIAGDLETHFGITLGDQDAEAWQTVSDVIATVERKVHAPEKREV